MDAFWYRKGGKTERISDRVLANSLHKIFREKEKLWIDIPEPSPQDYEFLKTFLGIHPRTIETMRRGKARPMVEESDSYLFAVLYGIDEQGHFIQLNFILGEHYLVTIHKRHIHSFELLKRDTALVGTLLSRDTEFVMHALIEAEIGKYGAILERFDGQIAEIEDAVVKERSSQMVHQIFKLKHQLITVKHHISPQKDALYELSHRGLKFMMPSASEHFRDSHMYCVSAVDSIDNYREILNGALEVHLSVTSNHLNDIIKVLTVFSTIFLPLTLIASIYGMNFAHMPEISWRYGYGFALGLMALVTVVLLLVFRRLRWL